MLATLMAARAHVGAVDALDQAPPSAALMTAPPPHHTSTAARAHVGAVDALDQECDCKASPHGTALEGL